MLNTPQVTRRGAHIPSSFRNPPICASHCWDVMPGPPLSSCFRRMPTTPEAVRGLREHPRQGGAPSARCPLNPEHRRCLEVASRHCGGPGIHLAPSSSFGGPPRRKLEKSQRRKGRSSALTLRRGESRPPQGSRAGAGTFCAAVSEPDQTGREPVARQGESTHHRVCTQLPPLNPRPRR